MASETFVYGSAKKLAASRFKRAGYTFAGWNTKANGKGKAYKNTASVKNLTKKKGKTVKLYARWKKVKWQPSPSPRVSNDTLTAGEVYEVAATARNLLNLFVGQLNALVFYQLDELFLRLAGKHLLAQLGAQFFSVHVVFLGRGLRC